MKITAAILLVMLVVSCGVNNRRKTEEVIVRFEQNHIPDKRETVFNAEASFRKGQIVLKGETDNPELVRQLIDSLHPIKVLNEITLLPDSSVGDKPFALVTLSAANLRAEPRHSSELITQALLGTPVKVLKKQGNWYLLQTPDKYISWADAAGIFPVTEKELNTWQNSDRMIYTGAFAQVYETQQMDQPVGDVTMGGILMLQERRWNYLKVAFPDGREGFTPIENWTYFSEFIEDAGPDSTSVVALAQRLKGRPYLWGGTSSAAMDCSGFTKMIYYMHGIILARDASLQARHGEAIDPGIGYVNLQPGDLLFFGQKKDETHPEKITHVAISLGGTEYIHAAGLVEQNSFDPKSDLFSEYRKDTFIRAGRIIGSEGTEGIQWTKEHAWY